MWGGGAPYANEGRYQLIQISIARHTWFAIQLVYQDARAYLTMAGKQLHNAQDLALASAMYNGGSAPWLTVGDMQRPPEEAPMWQQALSQGHSF